MSTRKPNTAWDPATLEAHLESTAVITSRLLHDFGNYLTGIMGFTELSQARAEPESAQSQYLQEVMQSATEGAAWIRRLHLFCRRGVEPGWPTLLPSVVAAEEARLRGAGSGLRWVVEVPADLPMLAVEQPLVQTALGELILNAREATDDHGTITINARVRGLTRSDCRDILGSMSAGEYVEITVRDDGPGFSAEASAKVFRDVFHSSKPRHRGLGLLAVYGIARRFGGGLSLRQAGDAAGASIRLYLPLADLGNAVTRHAESASLLLVHDDAHMRDSMRRLLESQRWRVSAVFTAAMGVGAFQSAKHAFQLILADVLLPGVSGIEMARKILQLAPGAQFLFLYTQSSFHGLAEEDLLKRFVLLRWPIDAPAFLNAVSKALTRSDSGKPQ